MPALDDVVLASADWPPKSEANRIQLQSDFQTLYRNRRDEVLQIWSAELRRYVEDQEDLVLFPAPQLACRLLAAFLFGDDPTLAIADDAAQAALEAMIPRLPATLLEGAVTQAVQGEVYLKVNWDEDLSPWPIISAVPGRRVIPTFRYGQLVDAVVVTEIKGDKGSNRVWRLFEYHEAGAQRNVVYRGTSDRLGEEVALDADGVPPAWADEDPEIETGLDVPLIFHVPFQRDSESPHGVSVLDGKEGLILALHRLYSVEQHDAEIARKRIAMPESYAQRDAAGRPRWDRRDDVLLLSEEAAGAVGSERPVTPIEFQDSSVQRERIVSRLRDFLIACGIAPQTFGEDAGSAQSGTARKLAQAMTLQTVAAAGRYWIAAIADCTGAALEIARDQLGQRVPGSDDVEIWPVSVELSSSMIEDPAEQARILADLDAAEAISIEEKVRRLHPDWDETAVQDEVDRIREERGVAPAPPPLPAMGGDDDDEDLEDPAGGVDDDQAATADDDEGLEPAGAAS